MAAFGRLDCLVNNAAVNPHFGPLIDADLGAVRKIFEVNVIATLAWTQLAWRAWQRDNGGAVLNVASVGGVVAGRADRRLQRQQGRADPPDPAARPASSARWCGSTASRRPSSRPTSPRRSTRTTRRALAARYPMKRLGVPNDTSKLAAFLLSDDASWITGQTVVIDGGITTMGGF